MRKDKFTPAKIIYNGVATVVFWEDGTKTVVKRAKGTKDDKYNAFCAALAKKVYGTNSRLKNCIKDAENAKRAKRVEINTEPLQVGDRVRVLDGSNIPNYTGGWCMDDRVGETYTVEHIDTSWGGDRIGVQLKGDCCTFDARGLEKV